MQITSKSNLGKLILLAALVAPSIAVNPKEKDLRTYPYETLNNREAMYRDCTGCMDDVVPQKVKTCWGKMCTAVGNCFGNPGETSYLRQNSFMNWQRWLTILFLIGTLIGLICMAKPETAAGAIVCAVAFAFTLGVCCARLCGVHDGNVPQELSFPARFYLDVEHAPIPPKDQKRIEFATEELNGSAIWKKFRERDYDMFLTALALVALLGFMFFGCDGSPFFAVVGAIGAVGFTIGLGVFANDICHKRTLINPEMKAVKNTKAPTVDDPTKQVQDPTEQANNNPAPGGNDLRRRLQNMENDLKN